MSPIGFLSLNEGNNSLEAQTDTHSNALSSSVPHSFSCHVFEDFQLIKHANVVKQLQTFSGWSHYLCWIGRQIIQS